MDIIESLHEDIDYNAHQDCKIKHKGATDCIDCCSKPYFDDVAVDYSCSQKRNIYAVRYVPAYVSELSSVLRRTPRKHLEYMLKKKTISVLSIGGGPGTDIYAFNKWFTNQLENGDNVKKIKFLRLDIHTPWETIAPKFIHQNNSSDLTYLFHKQTADISDNTLNLNKHFDVIIMSYVLSEIENEQMKFVISNILSVLSKKTLIIINDRPQNAVITKIEQFTNGLNNTTVNKIEPTEREHCGYDFPEEIWNDAKPTIFKKSIRYNIVVDK